MKRLLTIMSLLVITLSVMAQATSLVIDNQNPGSLSSKINYGDQQTVVNLKVTGYINQADVNFINKLISKQKLHGRLDLEDVYIVGDSFNDDNTMIGRSTQNSFCAISGTLKHLLLPKLLKISRHKSATTFIEMVDYVEADTLTVGGWTMPKISPIDLYGSKKDSLRCLIFREGVQTVGDGTGHSFYCLDSLTDIVFPSTLKEIGIDAFKGRTKLKSVNFPDSLATIGVRAFANVPLFADTVRLPRTMHLKNYNFNYFASGYGSSSGYIDGQAVYLPDSIKTINQDLFKGIFELHLSNVIPPELKGLSKSSDYTKSIHTYVPKASVSRYQNDAEWSKTTIIAEPNPTKAIMIRGGSIRVKKNYTSTLSVNIIPDDADSKDVAWYSGNTNVASVSAQGIVTGQNSGQTYIYVVLTDNPSIKDSCLVTVYQPVSGIQISNTEKTVKVGESFSLSATVAPSDADDKTVVWKSENDLIASVANGKVTGKKAGVVNIIATSRSDSSISAECAVTVLQPVTGIKLDKATCQFSSIGETAQITATVLPEDASNKNVNWRSSNENVCFVSNGQVVAVGFGNAVVMATTADGGYLATCTVNVDNATGVQNVHNSDSSSYKIYGIDGERKAYLQKGVNVVELKDGTTRKIVVK